MIFWRVIRFSDETEATNWDSSGCWSCLPAVEWDVGEVGARNVVEAVCITLKLLLYYDWFVLKKCFGKLLWGITLAQWPVFIITHLTLGFKPMKTYKNAGYFELGCEICTTGILLIFREVPGNSEVSCYILKNNKEVELIEHHTFLSLNI